jgi:CheY-like chemotaxis protein
MNTELLLTLGLALGLGVVVLALLLRSRRRPPTAAPLRAPVAQAAQPRLPQEAGPSAAAHAAAQIDAQRQAATEALRLARQRKAEDAARLEAERAGQARANAAARATAGPPARQPAPQPMAAAQAQRTVPLPAMPPAPAAPRPVLNPLAINPATPRAASVAPGLAPLRGSTPSQPPLVLLADDSKVVRVKTGRLLEKQGWRVLLAEDGAAALQALDSHAPDLLITDVEMPGLDGFELTRRVRAHARFARLPVIMITSSDERHRAEAHAAGVNLLLGKPYAEETLLAQVQVMLAAAAQRAALALH